MAEGFFFQGQASSHRDRPRGTSSGDLPPAAFVLFLQNHDQVGNRAFGERLTALAEPTALAGGDCRADAVSADSDAVHGGGGRVAGRRSCSSPIITQELGDAVREGRRKEFAHFPEFSDPEKREQHSGSECAADVRGLGAACRSAPRRVPPALYQALIAIRMKEIAPHLDQTRALDARPLGSAAVLARWRLGPRGCRHSDHRGAISGRSAWRCPRWRDGGCLPSLRPPKGRTEAGELPGHATVAVPGTAAVSDAALLKLAGAAGLEVGGRISRARSGRSARRRFAPCSGVLGYPAGSEAQIAESRRRLERPAGLPEDAAAGDRRGRACRSGWMATMRPASAAVDRERRAALRPGAVAGRLVPAIEEQGYHRLLIGEREIVLAIAPR